jgi:hypothetical protein
MAIYNKIIPSGSIDGAAILITATSPASPIIIHTASLGDIDELWMSGYNTSDAPEILHFRVGSTSQWCSTYVYPDQGLQTILYGFCVTGNLELQAYGSVASKLNILAFVNRITAV